MSQLVNCVPEAEQNIMWPTPVDTSDVNLPAAATDAVVTEAADPERGHILSQIHCSYTATPVGGNIKVEDGPGNVVFSMPLATAGPFEINFDPPRVGTRNRAMIITLASGAGVVVGALNVNIRRQL